MGPNIFPPRAKKQDIAPSLGSNCLDTGNQDRNWLGSVKCHKALSVCFAQAGGYVFSGMQTWKPRQNLIRLS